MVAPIVGARFGLSTARYVDDPVGATEPVSLGSGILFNAMGNSGSCTGFGNRVELKPRRAVMAVAIDGPVASGKTAVGGAVAERLGWPFLDTGAMYRAVTRSAIRLGVDVGDEDALADLATGMSMRLEAGRDGVYRLWADGEDVTDALRTPVIDRSVSAVSKVPAVRRIMVERQRSIAEETPVVMAGRDIGTVVLRDAPVKVYLTASLEERARRRDLETSAGDLEGTRRDLARRDAIDSGREDSPLRPEEDAVVIDTDGMDVEETARRIVELVRLA